MLGKKDNYVLSFDIEATEKDQKKRTSTLMLGALRESLIDTVDNEEISSRSETSLNSSNPKSVKPKANISTYPDDLESVFCSNYQTEAGDFSKLRVVNNLIKIDDVDEESPKLPEKQHHKLNNDFKILETTPLNPQISFETFLNDQPLINIDSVSLSTENSLSKKTNRLSSTSIFDDPGGINAILQAATIPSTPEVSSSEFENFWAPTVSKNSDPWGLSGKSAVSEANHLFENSFTSPIKNNLPNKANYSIDKNYANYSETVQREQKSIKQNKYESELSQSPADNKFYHKKSHSGWLKDKISSRINTGFTGLKQIKKYDSILKKDVVDSQVIKLGTPLEASEESRKKSHSFSRNIKSGPEGEFYAFF